MDKISGGETNRRNDEMRTIKVGFGFLGMFLLGCATAGVAAQFIVPPVRAGTNPARWEQVCVPWIDEASRIKTVKNPSANAVTHPTGWNRVIAKYGAEGWEMIGMAVNNTPHKVNIAAVCFKRPLS